MDAKHQFKYSYNEGCEDFSPVDITFDMPGDISLQQMLYNFQSYLKAVGFVFDGELEIIDHTFDVMDEVDGALYEIDKQEELEKQWDKVGCGCIGDSIAPKEYQEQRLKEWNEGIAKLDKEVKEQREIREKASLRADEAENKIADYQIRQYSPYDHTKDVFTFQEPPKTGWDLYITPDFTLSNIRPINWFNRKMQELILGFKWKRQK